MIAGLIIGRKNSKRLPNKNTMSILGKPLMAYPIIAAQNSRCINNIFLSTDSNKIKSIGKKYGVQIIDRPEQLTTDSALVEDVVLHGLNKIEEKIGNIDILVLLFCNVATISGTLIDHGIKMLEKNLDADSVVSVTKNERYLPTRARLIENNLLTPSCAYETENQKLTSSNEYYFLNGCLWITRSSSIKKMEGDSRFRWLGKKIIPIIQDFGLDINHDYEIPLTKFWLKKEKNRNIK